MRLYETVTPYRKIWWTQRDKNGNCFEIEERGLYTKIYILRMNEQNQAVFDTFQQAEKALKSLERRI